MRTHILLQRIAFALESIAAALARNQDDDTYGDVVDVNTWGGDCRQCGCRLIGESSMEDNECPACGATLVEEQP